MSAVTNIQQLKIDLTKSRNDLRLGQLFVSHYGWVSDPNTDPLTAQRIGNRDNILTLFSVALSRQLAHSANIELGNPVFINGVYIGNYDDTAPEPYTVDIYDPTLLLPVNWGGIIAPLSFCNHS